MKSVAIQYLSYDYTYPTREEPIWKSAVDRWYQLDAPAYGLAQAYTAWKPKLGAKPAAIWLASAGGSGDTDRGFVSSGGVSPAKFVHTLPSVRGSSLCQVMDWAGPIFCIQNDPRTLVQALREAAAMTSTGTSGPVWALGAFRLLPEEPRYRAVLFVSAPNDAKTAAPTLLSARTDAELHAWLALQNGSHFEMRMESP